MITVGRSEVGQFVEFLADKQYFFAFGHKNWAISSVSGRAPVTLVQVPEDEAKAEIGHLRQVQR
jgi:hypothetical protein